MKKIKIYLILLVLTAVAACQKEEYTAPVDLVNASWLTNVPPGVAYIKSTNEFISFADLSHGSLSREWIIEPENKFLQKGFNSKDSLYKYINKDLDTVATDPIVHVLFLKPGINKVKLRLTFDKKVTYPGTVPVEAVEKNGVWVIEQVWEVDVYGKLFPAFKVTDKNDQEVINVSKDQQTSLADSTSWPVVEVEAGDFLNFIDLTTDDRPESRKWEIPAGKPANSPDEAAKIFFFKIGTFNAGKITSTRTEPKASTEKIIPLRIKVIPSSKPFVLTGKIKEAEDETLSFGVTGEIQPFAGQEGNFTVNVKNGAFNQNIAVSQAKVSSTDATKINLTLVAPIYNTDEITVSYNGTGIKSVDGRTLAAFSNETVQPYLGENLIPAAYAGIETEATNPNNAYADGYFVVGNKGNPNPVFSRSTAKFVSAPASMKFEVSNGITEDNTLQGSYFQSNVNIPAGTYKAGIKVYLEPGNTMSEIQTSFQTPFTVLIWDLSTVARGQWVTLTQEFTLSAKSTGRYDTKVVKNKNPDAATGAQTMYIDDYSLTTVEVRP